MKQPLISFITPVYNSAQYLPKCIESVINQTAPEWELILIDDGSSDISGELCDRYASTDDRIRVLHKDNEGQFASRLIGIQMAKGSYCTGLDSDDYLSEDCVEILSNVIRNKNYDIVAWSIISEGIDSSEIIGMKDRYGEYCRDDFLKYVCESTDHSFCNKLIKTDILCKSVFDSIPKELRYSEDYILICPSICMSKRIIALDKILYHYRQTDKSVTHMYSTKRVLDYFNSTECVFGILSYYSMLSSEIMDIEYKGLIRSAGYCLKTSYKNKQVDKSEIESIRSHPIYKKLAKYESKNNLTCDIIIFMKLFRLRLDRILLFIYG